MVVWTIKNVSERFPIQCRHTFRLRRCLAHSNRTGCAGTYSEEGVELDGAPILPKPLVESFAVLLCFQP